ncbi:histidine kinase [Spongiactinospora sp. TRM90649]|uniref:sensor histidine kinase n=1 Tax=Spongiactinospora sp. TRM90649 TaxID=3031114 RepID=UPI0023F83E00|nr:histidine kinase [Spongiactinospora sp. TRM90649]MDF5752557.1 histidine kinase [Spongiactinospora sp. TRM90649]
MSVHTSSGERADYERVRRITKWSLGVAPLLAWFGTILGTLAELPEGAMSPFRLTTGIVGMITFSVLYARTIIAAMAGRTAYWEIGISGAITLAMLVIQVPTPMNWGIMVPVWVSAAVLTVTTAQAVLLAALATVVAAPLTHHEYGWTGAVSFLGLLCIVLPWGNRFQLWFYNVLKIAIEAKEAQARLAVTEERLRFSRDLHDLVGHSLSAIAVKSEVAVKLTPSDPDRAMTEMTEVRHLAKESLHEIRTAVRGYRTVDLNAELNSVRAVLTAAGIRCEISSGAEVSALPGTVSTLLAWIVREGTTNVLRHSSARRCRIEVETDGGAARLRMVNNGVTPDGEAGRSDGSGLAGLAERVVAQGGTLTAGPGGPGEYALSATVPVRGQT